MAGDTLSTLLRDLAARRPDHHVLEYQGRSITYRQLDERADRVASGLRALGISDGDRVAVLDKNSPEFVELLFGTTRIGAVLVPLNWRLAGPEILHILDDAGAKVAVVAAEFLTGIEEVVQKASSVQHWVGIGGQHGGSLNYDDWKCAQTTVDSGVPGEATDVAVQMYTSGTTGAPKGVMLTHDNILGHLDETAGGWGYGEDSVALTAMPLFHIAGTGGLLLALCRGGTTVLLRVVDLLQVVESAERYRITHAFLVPAVLQILLDLPATKSADWSSLQKFLYGAAPIAPAVLTKAIETLGCEFIQAYGLTECAGTIAHLEPQFHDPVGRPDLLRSCGRALPWVEIKIVDPVTLEEAPTGTPGELWTRSAQNMAGYWNLPEATAATITADGWLRTGDAAFTDGDGFLYMHDRIKDMIVSGGENIYPAEIEKVLAEHPAVLDVAVIGVPHDRWGETPLALVVAREPVEGAELIEFCRERLARFKCPTAVEFTDSLPRNPSGKLLKRELRQRFWSDLHRSVN